MIAAHPFAMMAVNGDRGPVSAHAPLKPVLNEVGMLVSLIGHVARANPFWAAAKNAHALVMFAGPDGYVSPSHYPSKHEHGRVVPTWNYVRIEARGVVSVEEDPAKLNPYVEAPTAMMEAGRAEPWRLADAPDAYIEALQRAIVGVRIQIDDVVATYKLSQNKPIADRAGAAQGLREAGASAIADLMMEANR